MLDPSLLLLVAVFVGGLLALFVLLKDPTPAPAKGRAARAAASTRSNQRRHGAGRPLDDYSQSGSSIAVKATADPEQVFELIEMRLGRVSRAPSDVPTLYIRYFGEKAMRIIFASTDQEIFSYRVDWLAERVGVHEYRGSMHIVDHQGFARAQPTARRVQDAVAQTLRSLSQAHR